MTQSRRASALNGGCELGEVLKTYADVLPIPSELVKPFLKMVARWEHCSGVPWTVARLKMIYTDFIRYQAGEDRVGTWIKMSPNKRLPGGAIGALYKFSTKGESETFSVLTLLRIYTQFKEDQPSATQLEKFMSGVDAPVVPVPQGILEGVKACAIRLGVTLNPGEPRPAWSWNPSETKRVPCLDGSTKPESTHWQNQWLDLFHSKIGMRAMWKWSPIFRPILDSFTPGTEIQSKQEDKRIDSVGSIGLIQEPGLKLRAVANPNRIYQLALEPLGDVLFTLLRVLPWDCTHEQEKAMPHVQQALSLGRVVHCVDLTDATGFFPLALQSVVLRELVKDDDRDFVGLFEYLSRAKWRMRVGGSNTLISWKQGQPLGLYPSFASFALTHGLLLLYLNGGVHNNAFFVLGDDVVILDDRLFIRYVSALKDLGCPTSQAKSMNSRTVAEFAGKIITSKRVFPQPKWREMSDNNFLDVVKLLGGRALRLCRPMQRRVALAMWEVPDICGGLGFNPRGKPLASRYYDWLKLVGERDTGEYLMSLDERLNRFFNPEESAGRFRPAPVWRGDVRTPDLDQRSLSLVLKHLPRLSRWFMGARGSSDSVPFKALGRNLRTVVPRDVLPVVGGVSIKSRLEVLTRQLRFR